MVACAERTTQPSLVKIQESWLDALLHDDLAGPASKLKLASCLLLRPYEAEGALQLAPTSCVTRLEKADSTSCPGFCQEHFSSGHVGMTAMSCKHQKELVNPHPGQCQPRQPESGQWSLAP